MNEKQVLKPDLCVIGGGSGGLTVAAGAVQMGASVVLIEKGAMGGDCLNTGCVPSKSLLAAAKAAQDARDAGHYGVAARPEVDFARVNDHVKGVIGGIAPHDSQERFEELGCTVLRQPARFTGDLEIVSGETVIRPRRAVIATGSRAMVPPIEGIDGVPYLTNETVFDLRAAPAHLIVLGGGPIGSELAQAHARLGSKVTVVEMGRLLPKDDPELAAIVAKRLKAEGVTLREGVKVTGVAPAETAQHSEGVAVTLSEGETITGSHLLVAAGRAPTVEGLDLDKAGIAYSRTGIKTDASLKTTNRKVYAIGDVAGGLQFTHAAGYHGGIVIRSALFRLPAKADPSRIPWVTYTDPELAQAGLTPEQGEAEGHQVLRWSFEENDRARAERRTEGLIKVVVDGKGRIKGCGIAGPHAGELILPWLLALDKGMKIGAMASVVAPYPTLSEVSKRAAGSYYTPKLFGDFTKRVVRFLSRFG